ncbi:sulfotransferase [Spongiibacter nanhainus]|uniref:Sulfotransferase n=1 Tax=Spongiibacter nanhainus TaxID=2794344 RepID=A0A7T4R2T6_9GAMM|nr:sulfotransferase [Spongiibacter nanhainus]QQD19434.1 sulfotransferase [Spongiibacter nanhainus]
MTEVFFVGAPKCGTSTLYDVLSNSGYVRCQVPKETHFFSYPEVKNTYYKVPFITSYSDYEKAFVGNGISADFSPSYLRYHKFAIPRIKKKYKNAKIVAVLREPVARAVSHYLMDVSLGYQSESIENALNDDLYYAEYIENSIYFEALCEFERSFKEVHFVTYEELFSSPDAFHALCRFLEIPSLRFELLSQQASNRFRKPRSATVIHFLRNMNALAYGKKITPPCIYERVKSLAYSRGKKPKIAVESLDKYFEKDIEILKKDYPHLGIDRWWRD